MRTIPLLLALAFVVAVYGEPEPGVHRVTGKYITHVHHYKIPAKGGAGGGGGGRGPPGGGGRGRSSKGGGGKGGKTGKCQQGGVTGLANSVNKAGQNILGGGK
nr:ctenidin-1 [Parasteatoda tepidariorum]